MKRIIKSVIFILTGFLLLQNSNCQVQSDLTESIKQRFLNYTNAVPREEIFIHSDREEYIAGEYLWFNIYVFDRKTAKPSLYSRIAYFELLNSENRPVAQKRILINKGSGPGQILLPDTLSPGTYTIRAYTNWMKNFLPDNCFIKDIKIYNSLINKPFKNKIYNGNILIKGDDVPDVNNINLSGITLEVNNHRADTLELFVRSDQTFRSENGNRIYLFIQTHGIVNRSGIEKILTENTKICISKKGLIPGINHITVFDLKGQPVCEKFIFSPEKSPGPLTLTIVDSCNIRSKISMSIGIEQLISDSSGLQNLSISITPVASEEEVLRIRDYMVFGTEYGLQILDYLSNKNLEELSRTTVDQLLSTVKSHWIKWPVILDDKLPDYKYQMEREDHFLSGRLMLNEPGSPDSSSYILMCSPGKQPGFQYAATDKEGSFSFRMHIDEGVNDLILMPDNLSSPAKLILESSFSGKYPDSGVSADSTSKPEPLHIQMWSANYQINKIYSIIPPGKPENPIFTPLKPLGFYGKPDLEIVLADYISLPTMEEIFFEIVPHVSLKKKKSGYEISVTDRIDDNPLNLSPVLLIDGVFVKDAGVIAELNPEIVEKIEVIKDIYMIGNYTFPGLVNIVTRSADYSCVPLEDNMIRLKYRVTDPVLKFPSPDYSSQDKYNMRIPDFRNTLYWNPSVKLAKQGNTEINFRTSDIPAEYIIILEGVLSDGTPVYLKKSFTVVDN